MPHSAGRPEVQLEQYALGGCWVVAVRGDLDFASLPPLRRALEDAGAAHPVVVLDASATGFADSSALNLLLRIHQTATLRLVSPSRRLARVLELTGTDRVFSVFPTVEGACS
ncbi:MULTISPECIES: STAS domain-containing protein [unclassified Streptomyces]|uniref:STAS domain-containing protein n=1 Tax=unclassified Streptomyces TaxID=2593676 RepID=UPI0033FE21BE